MILNKNTLTKHISQKHLVTKILQRATTYKVAFDKTVPNARGSLYPMIHFKKDEWIKAHKEYMSTMRKDAVPVNEMLLKIVEGIK